MKGSRYLNERVVSSCNVKRVLQFIFGGFFTFINVFGIVAVFSGSLKKEHLAVYVVFLFPSLLVLWFGIKNSMLIESARRYDSIISGDNDGTVTVEELSMMMGKPGYKIFKELEKLFRKGFLYNCTLRQGGHPSIVIHDAVMDGSDGIGFVEVTCSNCGGTNRIRVGTKGACSYCGAPVIGK